MSCNDYKPWLSAQQVHNVTLNEEIPRPWKQVPEITPPMFVKGDEWFGDFAIKSYILIFKHV